MSLTEWISVLKLSQMWEMKWIYDLVLQKIEVQIISTEEWIVALEMSTRLRIRDLRDLAIPIIVDDLDSLKKIELGTEYNIQPWLLQGYTEFITRPQTISVEDEEKLGQSRTSNLFRLRHRRLEGLLHDVQSEIRKVFAKEFSHVASFNCSPISHLRPEIHTATDPGVIRRDKEYYCVYIIFSVRVIQMPFALPCGSSSFRWKALCSSYLVICSRKAQTYSETCFPYLLQKAPRIMDVATNSLFSLKACARRIFDACSRP